MLQLRQNLHFGGNAVFHGAVVMSDQLDETGLASEAVDAAENGGVRATVDATNSTMISRARRNKVRCLT